MKSLFIILALFAVSLTIIPSATKADLVGVLPMTPGGNDYQAYYDTEADLTWLANGNANSHMDWNTANGWAEGLSINGVTGWRLPNTFQPDASCDSQGNEGGYGYNCTGSELGHFFYNVLGGAAGDSINTTHNGNYDLFSNVLGNWYWSATDLPAPDNDYAWFFDFNDGSQFATNKPASIFAWAVHSGNAAEVPLPATFPLLGAGLLGFISAASRKRPL
jgi:hypothetical protein